MKFTTRLALGTFTIVALTVVILLWGRAVGLTGVVVVALGFGLLMAVIAGRSIARPLVALSDAASDIAAGATPRFPRSGIPEIDTLVAALRRMHGELADRAEQLEGEKAAATAVIDAMVDGVLAADARGRVVTANPAARRLLSYAPTAALPDLPALFRNAEAQDAVARARAGEEINDCELVLDYHTVLLNARPLRDTGVVLVLHDLTEVRRLEAIRRDFVANVSHELKTPLTSIAGYADTLRDPGLDGDMRARFLGTIATNAQRMQALIDDLLDLARIESGRWSPQRTRVDVAALAGDVWPTLAVADRARQAELRFAIAPDAADVHADAGALRQILTNLFDNALRYVPADGVVTLRTVRADHGVSVSVEDNGSGIGADHLERIFERFYRVDPARSRAAGGTGLGLSIVRHLVESHGGMVTAESELQVGTTIRCWFPD